MKKFGFTVSILLVSSLAFSQEMLGSKKEAFMLLPANAIASGAVVQFDYSPNGNHIFYKRLSGKDILSLVDSKPPKEKIKNFVYSIKTGTSKEILLDDLNGTLAISPLGDDQHLFFSDYSRPAYQGFFNMNTGLVTKTAIDARKIFHTGDSPGSGWLMLEESDSEVLILTPQGAKHKVNLGTGLGIQRPYKEDTRYIYAGGYSRPPGRYYSLTINKADFTVKTSPITQKEFWMLGESPGFPILGIDTENDLVQLQYDTVPLPGNFSPKIKLEASVPSIIPRSVNLTVADSLAKLAPKLNSVCYLNGGALLIREIVPVDPKLAEKVEESKLKQKALQEAKQVGLAIHLFAADNDDQLPSGEDFNQKLNPYLRDSKMLDGFTFNSKYKNMNEMKDPANEEIGFKPGPGGRAVVYGDGSVRWKPNS